MQQYVPSTEETETGGFLGLAGQPVGEIAKILVQ